MSPPDFFTEDLDEAVLSGALDCAVHSAKDVPCPVSEGLDWCWLPWHADPRDVLVLRPGVTRAALPAAPRMGISSDRRSEWCKANFPDAELLPIRGNIESRLKQLDDGDYDGIVMAAAALFRLGLKDRITEWISVEELSVPDGQGILAMTFRADDVRFMRIRSLFMNTVTFVGASVGHAGFCTVAGIEALQNCDVCLHDTLLDASLMKHLSASAIQVDVGKRARAHTVLQEHTTSMIMNYVRRGLKVVRLKGGDPCVFGRLAEEVEALDALNLPYRVIPGISSLSVMGASTGILLTRRGLSNGFSIMTGRGEGGATSSVNIEARKQLPLVLFMSLSVFPELLKQLKADGLNDETPAAVVFEAGSPEELILRGTVVAIEDQLKAEMSGREKMPAGLVIIGDVARFSFSRSWGALQGQRVLLTCSDVLQAEASQRVFDAGGRPIGFPLIQLRTDGMASKVVEHLSEFDWLVVTSPSAVRCLLEALQSYDVDVRSIPEILACGPGTLRELRASGLTPVAIPEKNFGASGLLTLAKNKIQRGERVLRVRSDVAGTSLGDSLREQGAVVEDVCIYHNEPIAQDDLPPFDVVFFASSSAVRAFVDAWGTEALASKTILAIGKPTASALDKVGMTDVLVSPEATVGNAIGCLASDCVNSTIR